MRSARGAASSNNVKGSEIFSKDWCDLLFAGRNRAYGAYRLRQRAGQRLRFSLLVVAVLALAGGVLPVALNLYARYRLVEGLHDIGAEVRRLKRLDEKPGYTLRRISAGRGMPVQATTKGASEALPEIVDEAPAPILFGVGGAETFTPDEEALQLDHDTLHNRDRLDLPIEGPQLSAVQVVEEMPMFPGGLRALMAWLDRHLVYPRSCLSQGIEGTVEVSFVVTEQGIVRDAEVTTPVNPDLDRAALAVVRRLPRWQPGHSGGRVSACRITLPVAFHLD